MPDQPTTTAKWLGVLLGLSVLPIWPVVAFVLLILVLGDGANVEVVATFGGYLLSIMVLFGGCVGLFQGRSWARRVMLLAAAIGLPVVVYVLTETEWWLGFFALPHAIAAFMLTMPVSDVSPNYDEVRAPRLRRRYVLVGTLFAMLGLTIVLAEDEIREVAWDLREERWGAQCKDTGNREICGRWAMRQLFLHDDHERMRAGLAKLDEMCTKQKVHRTCEFSAKLRTEKDLDWMFGPDHSFFTQRGRLAKKACKNGDERACIVVAWLDGEFANKERAEQACERGDASGCVALAQWEPQRHAELCRGNWGHACGAERRCDDGELAACAGSDDELLNALSQVEVSKDNPALYMVTVDAPDVAAACDEGVGAACFAMGLQGTADVNPFAGDPVPVRSLEVTMGRGCELGHNASCYVFALRLLDQRKPSAEHQRRADELLEQACDRSHQRSCWLQAMRLDPADELDRVRAQAQAACEASRDYSPACVTRSHILAFDIGAEPFPIVDADGYRRMRWGCWGAGDRRSCEAAASLMLQVGRDDMPSVPPLLVQGSQLAETACRGRGERGCRLLFEYASFQHAYGMNSQKKLREKICPQVRGACDDPQVTSFK